MGGKTVLFLSDSFLPERISAAKLMTDLVREFSKNGDEVFVVTSFGGTKFNDLALDERTIRVTNLFHRSQIKVFRLISELICPIILAIKFRFSFTKNVKFDATIIYSPSIFWVVFLWLSGSERLGIKKLIIRDIFPLWYMRAGHVSEKSWQYRILNFFAISQFHRVDEIYAQSAADLWEIKSHFDLTYKPIFILPNWHQISARSKIPATISNFLAFRSGRTLLLLGNFSQAQNSQIAGEFLRKVLERFDLRLLCLGQKSIEQRKLKTALSLFGRDRVIFHEAVDHDVAIEICLACDFGFFSLASGNGVGAYPGKFVAYTMCGLPVFGVCPSDFEIASLCRAKKLGITTSDYHEEGLEEFSQFLKSKWSKDRIKECAERMFSVSNAYSTLNGKKIDCKQQG